MEVFSPPMVTIQASKFGLKPGEALDLITGYNFNKAEDRARAWEIIQRDQPALVIGSPECTMFSALHNLSTWTADKQTKIGGSQKTLSLCVRNL